MAASSRPPAPTISRSASGRRARAGSGRSVLIDIREATKQERRVAHARLLPMSQLRQRLAEIPVDPAQPVLLICNTQNRSSTLRALRSSALANALRRGGRGRLVGRWAGRAQRSAPQRRHAREQARQRGVAQRRQFVAQRALDELPRRRRMRQHQPESNGVALGDQQGREVDHVEVSASSSSSMSTFTKRTRPSNSAASCSKTDL